MSIRMVVPISVLSCLCVLATGCSLGKLSGPTSTSTTPSTTLTIAGKVHGGQQPVSGSTIQLYEANTTTNQGASTPMLTSTVTTAADGSFTITEDYVCPASNPLVYIVSTGGNPGLGGSVNNTDLTLMSLLGTCSSLSQFTYVILNELSTVASAQALSSFMSDYAHVGSSPSNLVGIAGSFATASETYDFSTGGLPGSAQDLDLPGLTLNTLANILAACVNSAGGVSGDTSPCGQLLSLAGGGSTDTVTAALKMVQSPGHNTAQLYALIPASPPFQPYFSSVPSDFTVTVGYNVPANIQAGTLDSNGHVWLYTGGYNYDTGTDMSTDTEGVITVYDNNFNQLFTISPSTGGLYFATSMAPDTSGNVYVLNGNNTISEFNSSGTAISPSGGWPTGYANGFTGTGEGNGYINDGSSAGPLSLDAQGNMWVEGPGGSLTTCYAELNHSGTIITPSSVAAFCTALGSGFQAFATDGSGNGWAQGYQEIAKVNASGTQAATAPTSASCFDSDSAIITLSQAFDQLTTELLYDHVNNQLWGLSLTGAGTITDSGTAVFCDVAGPTMPLIPEYSTTSTTPGDPYSAGGLLLTSGVLDGAGNLWFTTGGVAATGTVGSATNTFNGTVTYSSWLGELSPSGVLLSPFNASTSTYGYQPSGLGANVTATSTGGSIINASASTALLGVDNSGNIWAEDIQTNKLLKISGMATANTVNY